VRTEHDDALRGSLTAARNIEEHGGHEGREDFLINAEIAEIAEADATGRRAARGTA